MSTMPNQSSLQKFNDLMKGSQSARNYVIQTTLPDGVHWFQGVGVHPEIKTETPIPVIWHSPYIEDAMKLDLEFATTIVKEILGIDGFEVVEFTKAKAHAIKHPYIPGAHKPIDVKTLPGGETNV